MSASDLAPEDYARALTLRSPDGSGIVEELPSDTAAGRIVVEARTGAVDAVRTLVASLGGRVELSVGSLVQARVPAAAVQALAGDDDVRRVRPPRSSCPPACPARASPPPRLRRGRGTG